MNNYKIEVEEKHNYNQRLFLDFLFSLGIMGIFVGVSEYSHPQDIKSFLPIVTIFMVFASIFPFSRERYFITDIEVNNNQVYIKYKDRSEENEINGDARDFTFEKRYTGGKNPEPYLRISYNNDETVIKQYLGNNWNRQSFDDVLVGIGIETPSMPWFRQESLVNAVRSLWKKVPGENA